ncbi:MAG TPA: ectonucleotide pyrophosphatase/phosphodiesterase, partial [Candidatus Angelobacter sp.]|nr:ectonucleotide pyrophosphatase/phosphodiesterase [Candidatus Angelobacter sp.]
MKKLALILLFFTALAQSQERKSHPVVLISLDGLRPDFVLNADHYGLKIPNLRLLVQRGSFATGVRGVLPTVTYPSHTTLVTGVSPARHGIEANTTFDPLSRNFEGWYWYAEDIKVPTLWDAASDAGLSVANIHWPVTVGARITYNLPQIWRAGTADDRKLLWSLSTPGLLSALEQKLGPYADGQSESIESDENRALFAVRLIQEKKPDLTLAYFTALDHIEHETGPFSPQSLATLERLDAIVGKLTQTAQETFNGQAVIVVVSDHGFIETRHQVNLIGAFYDAGLIKLDSQNKDQVSSWDATVWPAGGSAAIVLRDPANAELGGKVKALLDGLAADPANGIDEVLDRQEIQKLGGFSTASFVVSLRPGYKLGRGWSG